MYNLQQIPSPCYVLDEKLLHRNLALIQNIQQQSGAAIICALKGFAMYSVFKTVKQYASGATASSLHEARLIFEEMGCLAHVYSPAYLNHEFNELLGYSSHITFNSIAQYQKFKPQIDSFPRKISCGLRVNPQYSEVSTDMYNPCIAGSRLGITRNQLENNLPEGIEGIHFHTLCENDSFTLERTLNALENRFGNLLHQAKWLNMGGGHLVTRKGYNHQHLINLITQIKNKYNIQVILEPGSAFAWQTGFLLSTVVDIVDSQGIQVAILDVSFAAHMPDCLEMPYKPSVWNAYEPDKNKPTYRLGGLTCLAGDFIGDYSFDAPLNIGDYIVFDDMIHYTMVKTTTFNGVNLPSIGIYDTNNNFKLVRKFDYHSYKDRLS